MSNQDKTINFSSAESMLSQERQKYITSLAAILLETNPAEKIDLIYTEYYLNLANERAQFSKNYYSLLFEDGMNEIVLNLEKYLDQLAINLCDKNLAGVRQKISECMLTRLQLVPPHVMIAQNAYLACPTKFMLNNKILANSVDQIWRFAGDKSTDFNYYTKRGLLLPIYASARLYYGADKSENNQQTKEFIIKALDKVVKFGSLAGKIKKIELSDIPLLRFFS